MKAVGIYVLKTHGQEHSGLYMGIMKDTKQLISVHSPAIILAVMAAVGNTIGFLFPVPKDIQIDDHNYHLFQRQGWIPLAHWKS